MEYRTLGSSGVKVPVLCLGAMTFGEADDKSFMHKVGSDWYAGLPIALPEALLDHATGESALKLPRA
jgi:hypothetical protein